MLPDNLLTTGTSLPYTANYMTPNYFFQIYHAQKSSCISYLFRINFANWIEVTQEMNLYLDICVIVNPYQVESKSRSRTMLLEFFKV